jgi:hypothetical protein
VKYGPNGFRTWGSELLKIPFPTAPETVNSDGTLIEVSVADDIHIYDTVNFNEVAVCKGHVSRVDALAFQPATPKSWYLLRRMPMEVQLPQRLQS